MKPASLARGVGFALVAAWLLPLLAPPPGEALTLLAPDARLLARLFPGVPPGWVAARLLALAAGATLLAIATRGSRLPAPPAPAARRSAAVAGHRRVRAALACAVLAAIAAPLAGRLPPLAQQLYVFLPFLPAVIMVAGGRGDRAGSPVRIPGWAWATAAVLVVWIGIRAPLLVHAPRAAIPIDFWDGFRWMLEAHANGTNVLEGSGQPGLARLYLAFVGLPALQALGVAPGLAWAQGTGVAWLLLAGIGVALLARRVLGGPAAPLAAAVFLFSPFVLLLAYSPSPFGFFVAVAVALLLLAFDVWQRASHASLLALGAVAGVAASSAYTAHLGALAVGVATLRVWRGPRPPAAVIASALLVCAAFAVPVLPDLDEIGAMRERYVDKSGEWLALEGVLLGQRSLLAKPDYTEFWNSGDPGPLDVALGSLLSPVAAPRTPARLWADALFEPLGAALFAVALVACALRARREPRARVWLLLLAALIAPATFASAYDRASLTRNLALPIGVALLAALGAALLRGAAADRSARRGQWAAVVAVMAGGLWLFDAVNPRVLSASHIAIAIDAVEGGSPVPRTLLLDYGPEERIDWYHTERIARYVPSQPLPSQVYRDPSSLLSGGTGSDLRGSRTPGADLFLWSPTLEQDFRVARVICSLWPGGTIYALSDPARIGIAFAATPGGAAWRPGLPAARVKTLPCDSSGSS